MKVIDLLNKIANGEEVPKKIKYNGKIYFYHKGYDFDYAYTTDKGGYLIENKSLFQFSSYKDNCWNDNSMIEFLNEEVEIIEENKKELHANNIEFNIYNDKKEFIITLDENDLGIDKLHLDNCYFYKENDKWYVKHINLKPIAYISQEHKIPEKIIIGKKQPVHRIKKIEKKINEILDYLEANNGIMD